MRSARRAFDPVAALLIPVLLVGCPKKKEHTGPRAHLEIVLVEDSIDPVGALAPAALPPGATIEGEYGHDGESHTPFVHYVRATNEDDVRKALAHVALPAQRSFAIGPSDGGGVRSWLLRGAPILRENDVESAKATSDPQTSTPIVSITLGAGGAQRFEDATRANVKKRLAIVVDGQVMSAPVVQSAIGGGRLQITLGADKSIGDARDLAKRLGD